MARRTTALLMVCAAAALVPPTTHRRRTSARHSTDEDDDPYLSPRSRLAGINQRLPRFTPSTRVGSTAWRVDAVDATLTLPNTGYVLNGGTEPAFSSPLNDIKQSGDFVCARKGCDAVLFRTDTKYDSGTGWPSFWDPVDDNVKLEKGNFLSFMFGTECKCAMCDGHLGHRFDDGPIMKSGKRYCINGAALRFRESIGAGPPPDTFPDAPPL